MSTITSVPSTRTVMCELSKPTKLTLTAVAVAVRTTGKCQGSGSTASSDRLDPFQDTVIAPWADS